jgi:ubiquinone/menaquinone biosynthesis C-methylase UbiE
MTSLDQLQKEPSSLDELKSSYDRLFQGWMGNHKNVDQANRILDLLKAKPGCSFIDIGCGLGYMVDMAAQRGFNAVGIDISEVALRRAMSENQFSKKVVLGGAENLPFTDQSFDYAAILGSLEHFLDPSIAIKETARIVKKEGRAVILVPNSHHIRAIYNVYKFGEILPEMQDFERFATRSEWERLFENNGLQVLSVYKFDTGMSRLHKKGRELFWYVYNILYKLFQNRWIPLNLTYTFIFVCQPNQHCDNHKSSVRHYNDQ